MMKLACILTTALMLAGGVPALAEKVDCEPFRCDADTQTAIGQCPCAADNHGRYVSCVAHAVRQLAVQGDIPVNCKGKITKCAARSTCGKPGFVTCHIPTSECLIESGQLTGTCENDPTVTCSVDLDCGSKCKIKSSVERCESRGGTVGTGTSCCAGCGG